MTETVYLVLYKGQKESAYTWVEYSRNEAEALLRDLSSIAPHYDWYIQEKDVS